MGQKILVIGGVACGPKAAARARRRDPEAEITILEKGDYVSYASCGLPYYVAGVVPELSTLLTLSFGGMRDVGYFRDVKDVKVIVNTEAIAIGREKKTVKAKNTRTGEETDYPYDKLVLATGAAPKKPPFPGMELENVYNLWTMHDAKTLREKVEAGEADRVCIVGGGLIGLEAAEAFINQACEVTIVDIMPQVLFGAFDPEMAQLVHDALRESEVKLRFGEGIKEFQGEGGKVTKVVTDKGEIETDAVLVSVGAAPNVGLAKDCGLELDETGAIKVDGHMRTSDPDIFAGGDCVEDTHLATGKKVWIPLGSTANLHGRVIGNNLTGLDDSFPGVLGTGIMKTLGVNAGATGVSETRAADWGFPEVITGLGPFNDKSHYYPGGKNVTIKVVADKASGKVIGVQAVGPGDVARVVDAAVSAITMGVTVDQMGNMDYAYAPPFGVPIEPLAQTVNIVRNKRDGLADAVVPLDLKEMLAGSDDFVVLDVRSKNELEARPPIGDKRTMTVDMYEVREKIHTIPKDKPVIVICQLGARAFDVHCALKGAGFKEAKYLEGGLNVFFRLGG